MTKTATAYKSPLHQMTQTTSHLPVERLGIAAGARLRDRSRRRRRHLQSRHRRRRAEEGDAPLEGADPGARSGRCRRRPSTTSRGQLVDEMSIKGAELLKPIFDAHNGQERPAVGADRSAVLPRRRRHRAPGRALRRARAEHHRQDPGDRRRHPGDRGSDLSRHQHQRHRLLLAAAVRGGGRGGRARPDAARAGRQGHRAPWARSAPSWSAGWTTG